MNPRIIHQIEKYYLSTEAQGLFYELVMEGTLDHQESEKVLYEALVLGRMRNLPADRDLFLELVNAVKDQGFSMTDNLPEERDPFSQVIC